MLWNLPRKPELGAAPAQTGPWPQVPGSRVRESQVGQLPQSRPLFYKSESLNHMAHFKGFDFYWGGGWVEGKTEGVEAIIQIDVSDQKILELRQSIFS